MLITIVPLPIHSLISVNLSPRHVRVYVCDNVVNMVIETPVTGPPTSAYTASGTVK